MSNFEQKDTKIDVFIETDKQIYTAGQFVEGKVYLNSKVDCLYQTLVLNFKGQEKSLFFIDKNTGLTLSYSKIDTYSKSTSISKFSESIIQKGNYCFPFKFLLPESLPGSFYEPYLQKEDKLKFNQKNQIYIRYILTAQLIPSKINKIRRTQTYSRFMNIREPLRIQKDFISTEVFAQPTCCGYKMYGKTIITMKCNKNFITPEEEVQISLFVNNSEGKKSVNNIRLNFQEQKYICGASKAVEKIIDKSETIHKLPNTIGPGKEQTITFIAKIPSNFSKFSTALGRIVGKYFSLKIKADLRMNQQLQCQVHLLFHSQKQYLQKNPRIKIPGEWNPLVFDKYQCNELPPYLYRCSKQIPLHNRLMATTFNTNNSVVLEEMMNSLYDGQNVPNQSSSASTFDDNLPDV